MPPTTYVDFGSVADLNDYIAREVKHHPHLQQIKVKGEISNWKQYGQRVVFLRLKDKEAELEATIWARHWPVIPAFRQLKDGDEVVACGELNFWAKRGSLKFNIVHLARSGLGVLFARRQEWFNRYQGKGYFRLAHKQPIPRFPRLIGIVTARGGAAVRDIYQTIKRRYPVAQTILFAATVQGETAKTSIERAVKQANWYHQHVRTVDVLIVGRGGGSIEDLWAFNEPVVVEAIYHSQIPVVTGIGHEIDTSLADLVADAVASTPTAAAERVTAVSLDELNTIFAHHYQRMVRLHQQKCNYQQTKLAQYQTTGQLVNWRPLIDNIQRELDYKRSKFKGTATVLLTNIAHQLHNWQHHIGVYAHSRVQQLVQQNVIIANYGHQLVKQFPTIIEQRHVHLCHLGANLQHLDPQRLLHRGYSLIYDRQHQLIRSVNHVKINGEIGCELQDGVIIAQVRGTTMVRQRGSGNSKS